MPRFTKDTPTALQNLSEEQRREMARIGQRAGTEKKRQKKSIRECLKMLGQMDCTDKEKEIVLRSFPDLPEADIIKNMLVSAAMLQKAAKGDTQAFSKIIETTGEKTVVVAGDPDNPVGGGVSLEKIKELKWLLEKDE